MAGMTAPATEYSLKANGVSLAGQESGDGPPIVLLHGLTASRRYVVMGSSLLERSGHRVVAYDARGHGESSPAPEARAYGYEHLSADLEAVLDELGIDAAVLAGASMGAHTALRLALERPERVSALALITPGYDPARAGDPASLARWDHLAQGLRQGGVEGFLAAYSTRELPEPWHDTLVTVIRQRMAVHRHPLAVADALNFVPRSRPFGELRDLEAIAVPTLIVGSRDEADPGHPLAIAQAYAAAIPGATLALEEAGRSPLAWQGGQLSKLFADLAGRA